MSDDADKTLAVALANEDEAERDGDAEVRAATADAGMHGQRLDKALLDLAPEFSRNYLQQLLRDGLVRVDGRAVTKPSQKVLAGQQIVLELQPTPQSQAYQPDPMELDVVFEDQALLVLSKPAGLVVHPAAGNWCGTLLNGLLAYHPVFSTLPRAGIVHRLDKDTSGLMMVAKTIPAVAALSGLIAERKVSRQYLALGHRSARAKSWPWQHKVDVHVDAAIGRDPAMRTRMAVVDTALQAGKVAQTDIHLLARKDDFCLVQCRLHTGRTHQIRVHMQHIQSPLVGDSLYGGMPWPGFERQALHAYRLAFPHPLTGALLDFSAALPADMRQLLDETGVSAALPEDLDKNLVRLLGNR